VRAGIMRRRLADLTRALTKARRQRANYVYEWEVVKRTLATSRVRKIKGTDRLWRYRRNLLLLAMMETHSISDIARITGYTRVRIHQIRNEMATKRG
jgi:hypothetical protein